MSNKKTYTRFSRQEFEEVLDDTGLFFKPACYEWSKEYIYESQSEDGRFSIRVYSTVDKRTDKSRDKGSDAIRVTVIENEVERPVVKEKRVNRIQTWPKNLKKRINKIKDSKDDLVYCNNCGSVMVIRENQSSGNKFWGCTLYPECKNTKSID